jgi:hypothetical protein
MYERDKVELKVDARSGLSGKKAGAGSYMEKKPG